MLERFKSLDDSVAADRLAYPCSLAPDALTDLPGLIDVCERSTRWAEAVTNMPGRSGVPDRSSQWFARWAASNPQALGAVLFRAGRLEEALQRFKQRTRASSPRRGTFCSSR